MSLLSALRNADFLTFLRDYQLSFYNGVLIIITIAGEQIFKVTAYKCPCEHSEAFWYALTFFICPTAALWIIGVAVSNRTWRVCHGCWNRNPSGKNGCCNSAGHLFIVASRAAVVPSAWLFVTLMDGSYYACMRASQPCNTTSEEFKNLQAASQDIAWIALLAFVAVTFIVVVFVRIFDSATYYEYQYLTSYQESEEDQLNRSIQEKTANRAQDNVNLIDWGNITKEDWDAISKTPDLQIYDVPRPSYATYLQKWVNERNLNRAQQQVRNEEPQDRVADNLELLPRA